MKPTEPAGPAFQTRSGSRGERGPLLDEQIPELPPLDERRFEITGERARGGIGRILEVTDRLLGRRVALKLPQEQHEPADAARFVREALITARLQHPAIVPVYDAAVRADGEPCYSMRLVPGATLRDAISEAPGLDERLALLPHVQAVADAIAYAHEEGIVHRDLKPGNVLVGPFGETVVIDWGLAKDLRDPSGDAQVASPADIAFAGELTRTGAVMGTPGYMSPEQARGDEIDERADVFAIGAVLYHLLTGSAPYRDSNAGDVLEAPPRPVEAREPGAPRDLVAIVEKAMAREPADRYPTAQALSADLKRFATGQLVGARRYSRWALARRWLARHRTVAGATVALVAALAAGVAGIVRERALTAAENNRLRLMQAQAVLDTDPTAAAAWLKTYRVESGQEARAVSVAAHAASAGVARHVLTLPQDSPARVCLAPSGRLAGVLGREGAIWLFDLERATRRQLGTVAGAPGECLFAGPDGRGHLVAYSTRVGNLSAARLPDGPARTLPIPGSGISSVRPAADGRLVVTGRDGRIHVVSLEDAAVRTLDNLPEDLAFTVPAPSGTSLYAADGTGGLWGIPLDGSQATRLERLDTPLSGISFSADGRSVIFASEHDVGVRDLASGRTRWHRTQSNPSDPINALAAKEGVVFIAGDSLRVVWWKPGTDEEAVLGEKAYFKALAVTRDGARAAWVDVRGTIFVADLEGKVVRTISGHPTAVRSFTITPDGRWLAASYGKAARVFELPPATTRRFEIGVPRPRMAAWPGGHELVVADQGQRLVAIDVRTGARRLLVDIGEPVRSVSISLEGRWAVAAGYKGRMVAVEMASGAVREVGRTGNPDGWVSFLDDHTLLAADQKDDLYRYDLPSGEHRRLAHLYPQSGFTVVRPLAGRVRIVVASLMASNKLAIVDAETGRIDQVEVPGAVFRLRSSHDGRRLATGLGDGRLLLWDVESRQPRLLGRRDGFISELMFSRDDRSLFAADESGSLARYWLEGDRVDELGRHSARVNLAVSSHWGRFLATIDTTGETRVWEPDTGGLLVWRSGAEMLNAAFLGDEHLVMAEAGGGGVHIVPIDGNHLVPAAPPARTRWLDGLTAARIDTAGEPISPMR